MNTLNATNKTDFYKACDRRLTSFFDALTAKKKYGGDECVNFKYNAVENIFKARNAKYVSDIGLKEHMVSYLSSGKAIHSSQVFSKQGAKGTRPVLEMVLKNSESVCKFDAPCKINFVFHIRQHSDTSKITQNWRGASKENIGHSCL